MSYDFIFGEWQESVKESLSFLFEDNVCCQTRISKEWSPICLKEINNYAKWGSSALKQI